MIPVGFHHSEETKKRMSKAHLGRTFITDAGRKRLADLQRERPHHPMSPETKEKISKTLKTFYSDPENKAKKSACTQKTWENPQTRAKRIESLCNVYSTESAKEKQRLLSKKRWSDDAFRARMDAIYNSPEFKEDRRNCAKVLWADQEKKEKWIETQKEIRASPEYREKMRATAKEACSRPEVRTKISFAQKTRWSDPRNRELISGPNSSNWQGGISFEPYCPKFNRALKERIRVFFGNRCAVCGMSEEDNGENLSCHHVEYNKLACCDGKPVHFAPLCRSCHSKTSNGDRPRWETMIHRIIDEMYGGRSYFTKEEWKILRDCAGETA